jgi:PAS domain S-box-containing protein
MDNSQIDFLAEGGEMGELMRLKDWNQTPLGHPQGWPKSLQTMLGVILHSQFPMFIWWGPELICFYNDAYRPSLGREGKHPSILGQPAKQAWTEIWDIISPLIHQVLHDGKATWSEDQLIPIFRNGHLEDVYWTFSYSRINNDEGKPYGVLVTCVETTEKIINQQRLSESNDLLRFSTEAAQLGTWDYNPQTGKFIANDRLKAWFGLSPDDETELQLAVNAIAEKDRERVATAIAASLDYSIQAPYNIEYTIINPRTNKEIEVLVKGKPFFNEEGIAYRFSGTMEDMTDRNLAKRVREQSEQNLRNLVEQAPVAMCVLKGPTHSVEVANEKMIRLWGKQSAEVMYKPIFEGLPEAKEQGLEELLDNVYLTGQRFTARERPVNLPRESGIETVYQNFVYEPLKANDGNIEGVIAVTVDVTEQVIARIKAEEAGERARLAIDAGNLGTFDYDIKNRTAVISPRFCEIFGACPQSDHLELVNCIYQADRPIREKAIGEAMRTGKLFYEVRIQRKDGSLHWARIEGSVLKDNEGLPYRMLGIALDFTETKELEQEREEYIAIASHELRNPLTSLKLSLELLSTQIKETESAYFLEKSREQVRRLITMTSELLNVSKISAGVLDLNPEIFNLHDTVEECIATVQGGIQRNKYAVSGESNISIKGDKFRIEQVLINLLSNASKYSPKGSAISINIFQEEKFVKVEVRDTGIGIDAEKIPMIFQKFSRVESDKRIEGYGLGLYISQQIIRKHGGTMGVESEKGKGSVFWFRIPY